VVRGSGTRSSAARGRAFATRLTVLWGFRRELPPLGEDCLELGEGVIMLELAATHCAGTPRADLARRLRPYGQRGASAVCEFSERWR
jgi:hypothetical protein